MLNNTTKTGGMPSFSYILTLKVILVVGFIVVVSVAILNFFFLDQLSRSRINQVKETAETVSNMLGDLTVSGIMSRDHELVKQAVEDTISARQSRDSGLLQISVILVPSGIYYASTNKEFRNRKVSQGLLARLNETNRRGVSSELLNYEIRNKTIAALQFLSDVSVSQNEELKRIAVVQILYDYNKIVHKTRLTLLIVGLIILISMVVVILAIFSVISSVYRKLFEGFHQISRKNFRYKIPVKTNDESGVLFNGFNQMSIELHKWHKEQASIDDDGGHGKEGELAKSSGEHVLRKAEITCLVARIPSIQEYILEKTPEAVDDYISEFLAPMEKTVNEYGGQVVKILGDKVYTFFEGINSVDNSIRAALKLLQQWEAQNHERRVLHRKLYDFGVGLHSTEGIAGALGKSEFQYTFIGEAASVAEYLCASTKREQILISSSMMDRATGAYQCQAVVDIAAKVVPDKDEILSVTPLTDDESNERLKKMENSLMDSIELSQENELTDATTAKAHTNFESSVTNMLEETLTTTPLEPLSDQTQIYTEDSEPSYSDDLGDQDKTDPNSLWDSFETKKDSGEA